MLVTFPHWVEEKLHGTIISLPTLIQSATRLRVDDELTEVIPSQKAHWDIPAC